MPESELKQKADFTDDLGADFLDLVKWVMVIEQLNLEIPDRDDQKSIARKDNLDYLNQKLAVPVNR